MKILPFAAALLFSSVFSFQPAVAQPSKIDEPKKEQAKREELPAALTKTVPESIDDLRAIQEQTKKVVDKVTPCVVGIEIGDRSRGEVASGSGVIVSKDGLVLTAGHVSEKKGAKCKLILPDGKEYDGITLGLYPKLDAGMIRITSEGKWNYCEIGKSDELKRGQWCIAIGHPNGFQKGRTPVVRLGRILNITREMIRTDCVLVGGDSGGPLFDMEGKVIAIHAQIGTSITSNEHVPIRIFSDAWDRMVKGEVIGVRVAAAAAARVHLGVIRDETAKNCKLGKVTEGSPAEKAGLMAGDVVSTFDGKAVKTFEDMADLLAKKKPGDQAEIVVQRGSETKTVVVEFDKPPSAWLGVKRDEGADNCKLADITDDSPAFKAGLKAGDVIAKFDGKNVKTYDDLVEMLAKKNPGDEVEIVVQRDGQTKTFKVKLDKKG